MEIVPYLKGFSEGYARQSSNETFEIQHLLDVEKFVIELCRARELSMEMGLIIGYGHDLGRLKEGVMGKRHSQVGADILKDLLKPSDFNKKERRQIYNAVKRHNQKSKIHGPYAELIKDADSMAHDLEGLVDIEDYYENCRVLAVKSGAPNLRVASKENWKEAGIKAYLRIVKMTKDEIALSAHSEFWVHDLRVAIRKMRSILWIVKQVEGLECIKALNEVDNKLKKMAKRLDYVRILQVALRKVSLEKDVYQDFQQKICDEFNDLKAHYDWSYQLEELEDQINEIFESLLLGLQNPCELLLSRTLHQANGLGLKEQKKLHALRISAKRIKYLSQMGLIQLTPHLLQEEILQLHGLIGDINDIFELQKLMDESLFSGALEELNEEVFQKIFLIIKISQQSVGGKCEFGRLD